MSFRTPYVAALLFAAFHCAACTTSPEVQARRQFVEAEIQSILSQPLEPGERGSAQRCLSATQYRDFRALDDKYLLFEGRRGKYWINTLRSRCPDLRHATVLRVRTDSFAAIGRICEMDAFVADDWFSWPWYRRWPWSWGRGWGSGMQCWLGKFQPVSESQVEAIEAVIRSR